MAVKASKDQNLTNIFSDETLDMYNWTGKGKRSIKTSKVFKIIKSKKIIALYVMIHCNKFFFSFNFQASGLRTILDL